MKPTNNTIAFPVATATGRARRPQRRAGSAATIVDLSSRRADAEAVAVERPSYSLTPGEVWDALNNGRLQVHYQPQYDMATGETIAAEALVRLVDNDAKLIYPDRFIEMAERSDLIVPLGRAVIERVCADLAACRAAGIALQRIAINLSARQLTADAGLLDFIDRMLVVNGLQYGDLEFELTERQGLSPDCVGLLILSALSERGARIVIDDFGIGYSSIVYLTALPISAFKLDRALVSRLTEDHSRQSVVKSLLMLAEDLKLDVIAEGIATHEQHEYLARAGCRYAQGFGYAKPMPIGDLQAFLTERGAVTGHC